MSSRCNATVQPGTGDGCTLAQYAAAKQLPPGFLRDLGVGECSYLGHPALRIAYYDRHNLEVAVRYRLALTGNNRFRWKSGTKPRLYGLWRLDHAHVVGHLVLVEGESDTQTLWFHDIPALGLPGATNWQETWADELDGIPTLYIVIEPDAGGQAVRKWLATSRIRTRARLVSLGEAKDPSALYLANPDGFREAWRAVLENAVPWADHIKAEQQASAKEAWACSEALAQQPQILNRFVEVLTGLGVAGEARAAQLLYLVVTSRLLDRPVSAAVKGPSAAGKSYLVMRVLEFFPPAAYYALSAMSEHALAYSREPLVHRILVVYEAAGLQSDFASYLVRSLLSEGRVRYETVERTKEGLQPRLIEREGPTGLLVTTTSITLHPENETRWLTIPVTDTSAQTRSVLLAIAQEAQPVVDLGPWHALQTWLEHVEHRVTIPFADRLAQTMPPVAVRLRRDFSMVLSLIRAHALLHQANRGRDPEGRILATLEDYGIVRELVADLVAEGVEAAVAPAVRETVEAVKVLLDATAQTEVTVAAVAQHLCLDKSAASRRVRLAVERGYLKNLEERKGRPARLVLGEAVPQELELLPLVPTLADGCTVAGPGEEGEAPPFTEEIVEPVAGPGETQSVEVASQTVLLDAPHPVRDGDGTRWPIAIAGLGPRAVGAFELCSAPGCPTGTFVRYGLRSLCRRHAWETADTTGGHDG